MVEPRRVTYTLEHLPNINTLQIEVYSSDTSTPLIGPSAPVSLTRTSLTVAVTPPAGAAEEEEEEEGAAEEEEEGAVAQELTIHFPASITPHSASITPSPDMASFSLRLPIDDPAPPPDHPHDGAVLTGLGLLGAPPRIPSDLDSLHCRVCAAQLTAPAAFQRAAPLPSAYWYELTDFWICHDEDGGGFPHLPKGALQPRQGLLLDGPYYVLVHNQDLDLGAVTVAESESATVACASCDTPLGSAKATINGVRFPKASLGGYYADHSVPLAVAAHIRDASLAHGVFRFIVQSPGSDAFILLWLLASNTSLQTNAGAELAAVGAAPIPLHIIPVPVLKILYITDADPDGPATLATWNAEHDTEDVPLIDPVADPAALLAALTASTSILAPARRSYQQYSVGYLLNIHDTAAAEPADPAGPAPPLGSAPSP